MLKYVIPMFVVLAATYVARADNELLGEYELEFKQNGKASIEVKFVDLNGKDAMVKIHLAKNDSDVTVRVNEGYSVTLKPGKVSNRAQLESGNVLVRFVLKDKNTVVIVATLSKLTIYPLPK